MMNRMLAYNIPKKKAELKITKLESDSREYDEIRRTVYNSIFSSGHMSKTYSLGDVYEIYNPELEAKYNKCRKSWKKKGYADEMIADSFGFLNLSFCSLADASKVVQIGLKCGNLKQSVLCDPELGVQLCRNADITSEVPLKDGSRSLLVLKFMKGKQKAVDEQLEHLADIKREPQFGFDTLVTQCDQLKSDSLFLSRMCYVYHFEKEVDVTPVSQPPQICPIAIVTILQSTDQQGKVSSVSPFDVNMLKHYLDSGSLPLEGSKRSVGQLLQDKLSVLKSAQPSISSVSVSNDIPDSKPAKAKQNTCTESDMTTITDEEFTPSGNIKLRPYLTKIHKESDSWREITQVFMASVTKDKNFMSITELYSIESIILQSEYDLLKSEWAKQNLHEQAIKDNYGYLDVSNFTMRQLGEFCTNGIKIGNLSSSVLASPKQGVQVFLHPDIMSPVTEMAYEKIIMMCKYMTGLQYAIDESAGKANLKDPEAGYNSISVLNKDRSRNFMANTVYLYQMEKNKKLCSLPRHVYPIAFLRVQFRRSLRYKITPQMVPNMNLLAKCMERRMNNEHLALVNDNKIPKLPGPSYPSDGKTIKLSAPSNEGSLHPPITQQSVKTRFGTALNVYTPASLKKNQRSVIKLAELSKPSVTLASDSIESARSNQSPEPLSSNESTLEKAEQYCDSKRDENSDKFNRSIAEKIKMKLSLSATKLAIPHSKPDSSTTNVLPGKQETGISLEGETFCDTSASVGNYDDKDSPTMQMTHPQNLIYSDELETEGLPLKKSKTCKQIIRRSRGFALTIKFFSNSCCGVHVTDDVPIVEDSNAELEHTTPDNDRVLQMTPGEAQIWGDNLLLLPKRNPICLEELLVSSALIVSVDFCEDSWSWVCKGSETVVPSNIENMTGHLKSGTAEAIKSYEIEKTKKDKKKLYATKKVLVPKKYENLDNSANENKSETSNDTYEEVDLFAHLRSAAVLPTKPLKRKRLSNKPSKPPEVPNNQVPGVMATDGRCSAKRVRFDLDKNTLHQWDKDPDLGPIKTVEDIHNEAAPMKIGDKSMLGSVTHQIPDLRPIIDPTKGYARLPDLPLFAEKSKSISQTPAKKDNLPNVLPFIPPPPTTKVIVSSSSLSLMDDVVSDEYVDSLLESAEPKLRVAESKDVQYSTALWNQVLNPNCIKNTELTSPKSDDSNCACNFSTSHELMDISNDPALNTPAEKHTQRLSLPLEIQALPAIDEYKCGYVHSPNYVKSCVSYLTTERSFHAGKSCLMSLCNSPMENSAPVKLNELNFTMPCDSAPGILFTPPPFLLHGKPSAIMHTAHISNTQAHGTLFSHVLPISPPPPPPLPPLPPPPPLPPTLTTDCISNLYPGSSFNLNCPLPSPPLPPPPLPPVPGYSNTSQYVNCSVSTTCPLSISVSAAEADVGSDIDELDMDISSDVDCSDLSTSNSKRESIDRSLAPGNTVSNIQKSVSESIDRSLAPGNTVSNIQKSVSDGAEQSVDEMQHDSDPEDDWLSLEDDVPVSYSSHVQSPLITNSSSQVETSHAMNGCKSDGGIQQDIKEEKATYEDTLSSTTVENFKKMFQRKVCEDFLQKCLGSSNNLFDPILHSEEELSHVNNLGKPLFNNVDIRIGKNHRVDIQMTLTHEDKKPAGLKPRRLFWETCPVNYDYCQCLAFTFSQEPLDSPRDTGFQDQEQVDSLRLAIAYSNTKPEQDIEFVIRCDIETICQHISQDRLEVLNSKAKSVMEETDGITTQGNTDSDIKRKSIYNLQQIVSSDFSFKALDTIKAENPNHCNTRNCINIIHIELALELARKIDSHALSFDEAEDILTKCIEGD